MNFWPLTSEVATITSITASPHIAFSTRLMSSPGATADQGQRAASLPPLECARVGEVLARIGDKWSAVVIFELRNGPSRFNALRRNVPGISQKMLALTLRGLERDGLVARTVYSTVPPRVEYELTALGHSLRDTVEAVSRWAIANHSAIRAAQTTFDRREHLSSASSPDQTPLG